MVPQSTDSKQDWRTPQWVFDGFRALGLTLDVAADDDNHLCDTYFTAERSALQHDWNANFWCNPPYRQCKDFLAAGVMHAHNHGVTGVYLLRTPSIGTSWWVRYAPLCLTIPVSPRINFIDPAHPEKEVAPHGSMFMIVTPKTVAEARSDNFPFQPMTAVSSDGIHNWLCQHWGLLF